MLAVAEKRATDAASLRARAQMDALRHSLRRVIPLPEDDCFAELVRKLDAPG